MWQAIFYIAAQFLAIGWTFSFITLNSERLEHDLQAAQAELKRLAITDYLTGLYNSRHFFEICKQEIQRARRYGHPLALILLDIDHFKRVNDSYGPAAGDRVLVNIAAICRNNLRQVDLLSRLGGEEFVVLMPETDQVHATAAAERIRAAIAGATIRVGDAELHITASLGVAMLTAQDKDIEPVLNRADAAMYDAKRGGRDKVSS